MQILYNNGSLGRQGKTTLAYTHYNYLKDKHYKFYTNDLEQCSVHNIVNLIPNEKLICISEDDDIEFQKSDNVIFDFGGKPDARLIAMIQNVDAVIIPIAYQSGSELKITAKNINAIAEHNKNIVIVVINTDTEDMKEVKKTLEKYFTEYKTFIIKKSKFIRRLANHGKTVFDIIKESKADKGRLEKLGIINQFKELYDYLETIS